jgi:Fe-S oxidoreductase
MPRLINAIMHAPGVAPLLKRAAGIAPERDVPAFAPVTFTGWFTQRLPQPKSGRRVLLWPDTFTNHFEPETAMAAVRVLERAGMDVEIPRRPLCCGRPLFDYGLLDTAKVWLGDVLDALRPTLEAGVPVVGIEPSCVAVFRDEILNLFPDDPDFRRLAEQTCTLAEFLDREDIRLPHLQRRAVVHGHCHQKAIVGMDADEKAFQQMGLQYQLLESGCCGLAGSFGYERTHYDVSMAAGERVLLPAVRDARHDVLVIADGFSCRSQIAQSTGRRALHLAQVIDMAARDGRDGPSGDFPERTCVPDHGRSARRDGAALVAAAGLATVAVGWVFLRRRRSRVTRGSTS